MYKIISIMIDMLSGMIIPLIILFFLQRKCILEMSKKRKIAITILLAYISAVMSIVGVPGINHLVIDLNCNFIPFKDIVSSPVGYILNIILFIPFGVLIPILYKDNRTIKKMTLLGFCTSFFIEIVQIFTHRATDIDDLITNTLGTVIGYYISKVFINKIDIEKNSRYELTYILGMCFGAMFLVQPFISTFIWNIIL